jgi:uncharacterized protein YdeI (YjbR/CyaY-like superfamily)
VRLRLELRGNDGNAAGFVVPDEVVDVVLDTAPRTVDVPDDLAAELAGDGRARETWATWSFTRQKEAARLLTEAKQPETRTRRLTKVLAELRD